jgi:signal transduction histidine kinase
MEASIIAPLVVGGGCIGLLVVTGSDLRETDGPAVTTFANQAAIAITKATLFEEVRESRERLQLISARLVEAQEVERRAIARELHDEVGQALTALKLVLEMGIRQPGDGMQGSLREAQGIASTLLDRVRNLSLDLRPAMLDDLGLLPALFWQFERYTSLTNVHVTFKQVGLEKRRFSPMVETSVFRIVQEALTNVARHAGVDDVTVMIWAHRDSMVVTVEDQGAGFDSQAVLTSLSTGLSGMQERVTILCGELTITTAPGAGTTVTARLPVDGSLRGGRDEVK